MAEYERIYQSSFGTKMARRKELIEALPAAQLKRDLEALNRCSYIIGRNGQELADHVSSFLDTIRHVDDLTEEYENELVRHLHNYLAAVTSLIDAQRVVMRHRWPSPGKNQHSEFETKDYSEQLGKTFETGEAAFMVKLRNYCTHYSVPLPSLGTTMSWENGGPTIIVNTLQLEREQLLKWDNWGAEGKKYLQNCKAQFDLAPIIERYMKSVGKFYQWFWTEINTRSADILDEYQSKATELKLWYDQHNLRPDWFLAGEEPPTDWNGARAAALKKAARYQHGSRGFRVSVVTPGGEIELGDDDWDPLPR